MPRMPCAADADLRAAFQRALDSSVVVAAAFSRDARIGDAPGDAAPSWDHGPAAAASSSRAAGFSEQQRAGTSDWLLPGWQQQRRRARLVGFVRASGDASLVGAAPPLPRLPRTHARPLGTLVF